MAKTKATKKTKAPEASGGTDPKKALAPTAGKNTQLAKTGGAKLAGRGFENLETSDVLLPRLKLLQPLSPECNNEGTEKPGTIFLSLSGESMGTKMVITASTLGSFIMVSNAILYLSGPPSPRISTGFLMLASSGRLFSNFLVVLALKVAISRPSDTQASVAIMAGPPAFDNIATRFPAGNGWFANASA